jgi:hypothetical protein
MGYYYTKTFQYFQLRLEFLSEISKDIAQVFLALSAAELFKNSTNWKFLFWELCIALLTWTFGIISFRI